MILWSFICSNPTKIILTCKAFQYQFTSNKYTITFYITGFLKSKIQDTPMWLVWWIHYLCSLRWHGKTVWSYRLHGCWHWYWLLLLRCYRLKRYLKAPIQLLNIKYISETCQDITAEVYYLHHRKTVPSHSWSPVQHAKGSISWQVSAFTSKCVKRNAHISPHILIPKGCQLWFRK